MMKRYKPPSKKNGQISGQRRARRHHARIERVNRRAIISRDGSTCYMCGRKLGRDEVVLDHEIPLARGGPHCESNLRVACSPCNLRKGNKLLCECDWLNPFDGTLTIMTNIPDKDAPANPYQATTIANLVTQSQLHWLEIAASSVGMTKEAAALKLFNCPVNSLSPDAANQMEQYFARVKMAAQQNHAHNHTCAICCAPFPCNQSQCDSSPSLTCDACRADLFGAGDAA